ncbi:hypothetical protein FRC06_002625, partial [Ceratobasidium sp. 370]
MSDRGHIPETIKAFPLQVPVSASPILPVAHTSTDLVLGGTSAGDVPIVKSWLAAVPRLHQGDGHLIRSITPHGSSIIVGSTGPIGEVSLKCFSQTTWRGRVWPRRQASGTPFHVTLSDVLVTAGEAQKRTMPPHKNAGSIARVIQSGEMKVTILAMSVLMILVLASSPPGAQPYQEILQTESSKTGVVFVDENHHWLWVKFGVKQSFMYPRHQIIMWSLWAWSLLSSLLR